MPEQITRIYVYADWSGELNPMGILSFHHSGARQYYDFQYDTAWLKSKEQLVLDPDLQWFEGRQFSSNTLNFGIFTDSMPDTWGRTLMQRRNNLESQIDGQTVKTLRDVDYLLGVYDNTRMGALRYKLDPEGPFLDNNDMHPTPQWTQLRDLEEGVRVLESDANNSSVRDWLRILLAPGSSLGGARPKANILDTEQELWIAKFPSKNDVTDQGAWEYVAYLMAIKVGINMSPSQIMKCGPTHHTFITKRFDRQKEKRIHFASAMTLIGHNENDLRQQPASYLELVDFIENNCSSPTHDLHELWRRIVFSIYVSNTDDHLRNHGFIIDELGWKLSPAYDINPSVDKTGLSLNIDLHSNDLDPKLARSVGKYFRLSNSEMDQIESQIIHAVTNWNQLAEKINLNRSERSRLQRAFRI
jgi:serine/threonine-protein kinase HipA